MSLLQAAEGLDAYPRRIFLHGQLPPVFDSDGFVLRLSRSEILSASDLLSHSAVLVVAPPWTGKTYVAKQLREALRPEPQSSHLTSFEDPGTLIEPSWWEHWRESADQAYWLVDAVDEDVRRGGNGTGRVLALLEGLNPKELARLHLLVFARVNEVPGKFQSRLSELFGEWSSEHPHGLRRVRLAGLDREAARGLVGADHFEHVCRLIQQNELADLASLPAVLEHLRKSTAENLPREEVWRGVLKDLLRDRRNSDLLSPPEAEIEDCFAATQWLAAVLTFSGHSSLELEAFIPGNLPDFRTLRQAARAVSTSAVFERTDSGFRFAQDHVREWFAAFALEDMRLIRVRPLLTDACGQPNPVHRGLMSILARISRDPEVRDWITTAHGGLAPPSDAAPWSPLEALQALDRLQMLARSSSLGLDLWREERLGHFAVPGMGSETARRLGLPLPPAEQQLLLDVARAIGAPEPLQPALRLLQDQTTDERVRALAVELLDKHGTKEDFELVSQWARSVMGATEAPVLSHLASCLLRHGVWDFEETAAVALAPSGLESQWLQFSLSSALSLDRARWLIRQFLLPAPQRVSEPLLEKALQRILWQRHLGEQDYDLLVPLALEWDEIEWSHRRRLDSDLQQAFRRNPAARRKLFLEELRVDPEAQRPSSWRWKQILQAEDLEWLIELIRDRRGEPAWLLQTAYFLSYWSGVTSDLRRRARNEIRARDGELLKQLDRERQKGTAAQRRWQTQRTRDKGQIYELEPLVRETLNAPDLDLRGKMLRLAWSCFTKPGLRPTNVNGRWEDLPDDLRTEALELCRTALDECMPTPIPEVSSFPSSVLWEAACFHQLASEQEAFLFTSEKIHKWLPALLKAWESEWEPTLRRCMAADRQAGEDVFVQAVLRETRGEPASSYLVQQLPHDLWSEHLAARLEEEVIGSHTYAPAVRIDLLERIARIFPSRARAIALGWAERETAGEQTQLFREAGTDILLAVAPEVGWPTFRKLLDDGNAPEIFLRMRSLLRHHAGPDADLSSWPPELLCELAHRLAISFPAETDPVRIPGQAYSLGGEDDLRSLRDDLPSLLLQRNRVGDSVVLEHLAQTWPKVRRWLDQAMAQQGAEGVLAGVGRMLLPSSAGEAIPLPKVIRLLQDERYRLTRTVDDLQAVVLAELRVIAGDAKQHLAMLYRPMGKKKEQIVKRERLHEEALQAYICCRLRDRLVPAALEPQQTRIFFDREPLAARNTRNDVKVQTVSLDEKPLTVIIEIKWSDHPDVSTGQVEQLAKQYLLENTLTHGIYLVGWCGGARWNPDALGDPPAGTSLKAWRQALENQAQLLQREGLTVESLLLDLRWEAEDLSPQRLNGRSLIQ